tara:strand:- start:141 stop:344 length:204 start_codon:yes stop_codon:yes gene_type:complete
MEKIAIYVPDAEAKMFLKFQEYYDTFCLLEEHGVFEVRNGSVTMHMDKFGAIKAINRSDILYSSRHE